MPTSISPMLVLSEAEPRVTPPTRTSPLALRALTSALAWSTEMLPLAAFTRRSPSASPIQLSPLEFLITALPSIWPSRTRPDPVLTSAGPATRSATMAPAAVLASSGPVCSSWMSPAASLSRHSPRRPAQRNAATEASPYTCEPVGRPIVTSIDPGLPNRLRLRCLGVLTRSRPAEYSTRVCSAARTSGSWDSSLGRISTAVSSRSLAVIRTSPTTSSSTAETGSGVSKVGMTVPPDGGLAGASTAGGSRYRDWRRAASLPHPAGVALAAQRRAPDGAAVAVAGLQRGRLRADEPGVDREPGLGGGLLDPALEVFGEPEADPCRRPLLALRRGRRRDVRRGRAGFVERLLGRRWRHHEAGLAPAEAQVHRARREVTRDLGRRRRQRVQQDEPHGRLERSGEPLGQRAGVVTARIGGYRELLTEVADVRREVHDVSMTSL